MVHLVKIDDSNVREILDLDVSESQQRFVASNKYSMDQVSAVEGTEHFAFPFGIYDDSEPVGFIMVGFNEPVQNVRTVKIPKVMKNNYSIWRFMIDRKYQGKGYGRKAINLALDFVRTFPCGKADYCILSYKPNNEVAKKLYHSIGFIENGEFDGDEAIAVLKL